MGPTQDGPTKIVFTGFSRWNNASITNKRPKEENVKEYFYRL